MIREAWTVRISAPRGENIIVVKVPKGSAGNRGRAQRVIIALQNKIPVEQLSHQVVVIDGEPIGQPLVIGTSDAAEQYVTGILSQLATYRWDLTKLDW